MLYHWRLLTIPIMVLSTIQLCMFCELFSGRVYNEYRLSLSVASIGTTIGAHDVGMFSRIPQIEPVVLVWMLSSVVTDAVITVALVWWLVMFRSTAVYAETDVFSQRNHKRGTEYTNNLMDTLIRCKF